MKLVNALNNESGHGDRDGYRLEFWLESWGGRNSGSHDGSGFAKSFSNQLTDGSGDGFGCGYYRGNGSGIHLCSDIGEGECSGEGAEYGCNNGCVCRDEDYYYDDDDELFGHDKIDIYKLLICSGSGCFLGCGDTYGNVFGVVNNETPKS